MQLQFFLLTPVSCLLTPGYADIEQALQNGSLLTFDEWKEITESRRVNDDYIVLIDGTKLYGTLGKLPPITYTFANLDFDPGELMTVGVANINGTIKLQYITREGHNYVGTWSKEKFQFWSREPFQKHESHVVEKEIDPKIISFIVLKNRDSRSIPSTPGLASLELNNGDHLPVAIMTNPILLTDGWSDKKLKPDDILEICFDGGLHGTVLQDGNPVDMSFLYIKDKYLMVQIPRSHHLVKLPWEQVAYIQGHNGGFRKEQSGSSGNVTDHTVFYDDQYMPPREIGTVWIGALDDNPDGFGIKNGDLLKEASGSLSVASSAIAGLDQLGQEELIAIQALFDDEDETGWHMDIAFEELADEEAKEQAQFISLDEADALDLQEAMLYADMENMEVDPDEFNVPEIDEELAAILEEKLVLPPDDEKKTDSDYEEDSTKLVISSKDAEALQEIMSENDGREHDFSATSLDDLLSFIQVVPPTDEEKEPKLSTQIEHDDNEEMAMIVDMPEPVIIRDIEKDENHKPAANVGADDKEKENEPQQEPETREESQKNFKDSDEAFAYVDPSTIQLNADADEPDYILKEDAESATPAPTQVVKDDEPDYIWKEEVQTPAQTHEAVQEIKDTGQEKISSNEDEANVSKGSDFLWEESDDNNLSPEESAFVDELLGNDDTSIAEKKGPASINKDQMALVKEQLVSLPNDKEILLEQYAAFLPLAGEPALLLKTDPYYISLHPVTNGQYEKFIMATGRQPPVHWLGAKIPQGQENTPVVNVTYQDAEAYAVWANERLPTLIEWKLAKANGIIKTRDPEHLMEWTANPAKANHRVVISCTTESNCQMLNENIIDFNIGFRTVQDVQ